MRYLSVCSGIEAASVAWHPLGWRAAALAEIAPFPRAVLAHHYPAVPLLGDFTTISRDGLHDLGPVQLLVGGTPCQSFSVAGLRKGLDDPRGNLALAFLRLADLARPRWVVWENVPGVLSSNGGRDFGSFLGALGQLGYGFAYRVLDAQHFGVPQRRRRVFVVGHLGGWAPAAAVLFERACLSGHPAPRRQAGQRVAGTLEARAGSGGFDPGAHGAASGHLQVVPGAGSARPVSFNWQSGGDVRHNVSASGTDALTCHQTPAVAYALQGGGHTSQGSQGRGWNEEVCYTLNCMDVHGVAVNVREPLPFDTTQVTSKLNRSNPKPGDPCHPLAAGAHAAAVAFTAQMGGNDGGVYMDGTAPTLSTNRQTGFVSGVTVRRITPREAERLQGFPDDWTLIPWRGKPASECPDGPRYHALGNSMAVPVMRWIGERIATVDAVLRDETGKLAA